MSKLRSVFGKYTLVEWFLLLQPGIDLLTSLVSNYKATLGSIGVYFRLLFLLGMILYLCFRPKTKYKGLTLAYLFTVGLYGIMYLYINLTFKDNSVLFQEMSGFAKAFYFPISFLGIMALTWNDKRAIERNVLLINAVQISLILVIPTLFNLNYDSYGSGKFGSIGLFFSPNEISAITVVLLPFVFSSMLQRPFLKRNLLFLGAFMASILIIGTKVPAVAILCMLFITALRALRYLVRQHKLPTTKNLGTLSLVFVMTVSLLGYIQVINYNAHSGWISDGGLEGEPVDETNIDPSIELYKDLDPFLVKSISLVFSSRDRYFLALNAVRNDQDVAQHIFGMGVTDYAQEYKFSNRNTIEIDPLDFYFDFGYVGLFLIIYPFLSFFILVRSAVIKHVKRWIRSRMIRPNLIALILISGVSFFSGHVFTAPAVSIYVAAVLADMLIRGKNYGQ